MNWKSADGKVLASKLIGELEILINGMLGKATLLDLVRSFIVFEKSSFEDPKTKIVRIETVKKLAAKARLAKFESSDGGKADEITKNN